MTDTQTQTNQQTDQAEPPVAAVIALAVPVTLYLVESSNLDAVGYHEPLRLFVARFKSGDTWAYPEVDPKTWARFLDAESKGGFFRWAVRNPLMEQGRDGWKVTP